MDITAARTPERGLARSLDQIIHVQWRHYSAMNHSSESCRNDGLTHQPFRTEIGEN